MAAAAVILGPGAGHAAAGDPTFETPTGNPGTQGSVGFFDATGAQIYGGAVTDDPIAAYFSALGGPANGGGIKAGDSVATAFTYAPQDNKPADQWTTPVQLTGGDTFGTAAASAGYPGVLKNSTKAIAVGLAGGTSVNNSIAQFALSSVNDPGIMQVRITTSQDASKYYSTDIKITGSTWTQVFPAPPASSTPTTTTLSTTPASPQLVGTNVTLSATVAATNAGDPAPAGGSVQFFDGATQLGTSQTYTGSAVSVSTTALTVGTHSLTAKYVPATGFAASTSIATSYLMTSAASTTTMLGVSPSSPITVGDTAALTATVAPSTATGSVKFFDGVIQIGADAPVTAGSASATTSTLTVGTHSLKATFVPSGGAFLTSTSVVQSYVVNPLPAQATTTTLAVAPAGPVNFGTSVDLSASVSPAAAAGAIQFKDGALNVGAPVAVSAGAATLSISTLGSGSHALTATFIPANSTLFGTSTSTPAINLTVNAQNTTTALTVTPAGPVDHGSSVTLKATLTPGSAAGTVTFKDGATAIGSPVTVAGGIAQLATSTLPVATHTLTAEFTPANAALFAASTSAGVSLVVQNPPPGATHTALSVTPAGPVVSGTTVTLKATVTESVVPGNVQFSDGASTLGAPVAVTAGIATITDVPAIGSHSYLAVFTPADTTTNLPSTSSPVTLTVHAPATPTTTALSVTPAGPVAYGTSVTLDAGVTPIAAAGSVQFLDGATVLGTSPVTAGAAALTLTTLGGGVHSLTAKFVPTDSSVFAPSTSSPAASLTVNPRPTSSTLAASPSGPVTEGHPVTLTATVAPTSATGTVQFFNGTTALGTATVTAGKAKLVTTALPVGDQSLTATFTPTIPAAFAPSTSAAMTVSVKKAPEITVVTVNGSPVSGGAKLHAGDFVTLAAIGFQPGESVGVVLQSAPVTLTTVKADQTGAVSVTVQLPSNLAAGAHSLTLRGSLASSVFTFTIPAAVVTPSPSVTPPSTTPATPVTSGGGSLAATGTANVAPLSIIAAALLVAGGFILLSQRRRRSH
jgi:LPXTG-motif cell wall-anchored protein